MVNLITLELKAGNMTSVISTGAQWRVLEPGDEINIFGSSVIWSVSETHEDVVSLAQPVNESEIALVKKTSRFERKRNERSMLDVTVDAVARDLSGRLAEEINKAFAITQGNAMNKQIRVVLPLQDIAALKLTAVDEIENFCAQVLLRRGVPCQKWTVSDLGKGVLGLRNSYRGGEQVVYELQPESGRIVYFEDFTQKALVFEWVDDGTKPGTVEQQPAKRSLVDDATRQQAEAAQRILKERRAIAARDAILTNWGVPEPTMRTTPEPPSIDPDLIEDRRYEIARILGLDPRLVNEDMITRLLSSPLSQQSESEVKKQSGPAVLALDDERAINLDQ